jgi:Tol biopolymer transport system component
LLTDIEVSTAYSPTGEEALLQLPVNNQQFNMGMFDPTGKALAVLDVNGTLWVWDLPSGHRRFQVTDNGHFQWSPDGSRLIIVREDSQRGSSRLMMAHFRIP